MEENKIERRGGYRAGAGRKKIDDGAKRVQMIVTIKPETRDKLKAAAKECGMTVGRYIDLTIGE